ncbi:hypothetical protein C1H76_8883 [Elsinoe australis]|uniref:Uncharacterized protein n=1 Tax=Elsinoe australis TaxID=40998 RepID=A0A4U7ATQ4_9PEZI|nr:hypothetical protein C1H76_8883 [Elsinoe australis]
MPLLADEQVSGSTPPKEIPLHDCKPLVNCVDAEEAKLVPVLLDDSDLLTWRPLQMRTWFPLINAAACIAIIGGIFSLLVGVGGDRTTMLTSQTAQILTRYTPTFIGTVTYLIFRSTVSDIFRILPFIRMADQRGRITQGASPQRSIGGSYFPFPFVEYRDSPLVKCTIQILLLITSFLTANKAMLLGSQKMPGETASWKISVHRSSAFYLIAAYCCMAIFYIATSIWLSGKSTGLKWDPASPLDHLALVINTNALPAIGALPLTYDRAHKHLENRGKWRIGYWQRTIEGESLATTVYGIGLLNPQE